MPTISVNRDHLFNALGKTYTDDEFQDLCFEFGLELDEVTTEKQMVMKEQGEQAGAGTSEDVLYRIDIPANRYDLLSLEGLVNGLLIFQGKMSPREYVVGKCEDGVSLHLTAATARVRPYAVAAVLRDVTFTKHSLDSFIDLQEKLHQNICRKRTLVAIGTHDLDTVRGPFVYDALPPEDIRFRPLNQPAELSAPAILELYASHPQLKQYVGIIRDSPVLPVVRDRDGVVLSLPPLINSDHSKVTLRTRNVFIECTATDLTKAEIVLEALVCQFWQHCGRVCGVQVFAADGQARRYPALAARRHALPLAALQRCLGVPCGAEQAAALLARMGLQAERAAPGAQELTVRVPPWRRDVIHAADLFEDVAIAYGYNRIRSEGAAREGAGGAGGGAQSALGKLTERVRAHLTAAGLTETLSFTLCSMSDLTSKLCREEDDAVQIANPKTLEFEAVRTRLLPGLLRTLAANRHLPLPLRLFEVSDAVLADPDSECGARNVRRVCVVMAARVACFERVRGVLDLLLRALSAPRAVLHVAQEATWLQGRGAHVHVAGRAVGAMGVLHPRVLSAFDLPHPVTALEIDLEPFL